MNQYHLSPDNFKFLQEFIDKKSGIHLSDQKDVMLYGRLVKRLRELSLPDFDSYCHLIKKGDESEINHMLDAVTTNVTRFFREEHHFKFLKQSLLEHQQLNSKDPLHIWSAGCSSGEEPYSIAMTVLESLGEQAPNFKILATDLSSKAIHAAKTGEFNARAVENIPKEYLSKWFLRGKGKKTGLVRVTNELEQHLIFKQDNLMGEWIYPDRFNYIFCRNVIIYFGKAARQELIKKFSMALKPQGYLILGHSENLYGLKDYFELVEKSVYRRKF